MGRLDIKEEAKLLQTIGGRAEFLHKRNRPLSPIQVAKDLRILLEDNNWDYTDLSKRLDFSEDMIKVFLNLLDIPATSHNLVGWGNEAGRMDFSTAARIAKGMKQNDERDKLIKLAIFHDLKKQEIIDILQLRKKDSDVSLDEIIERVLNIRPVIEKGYVVIAAVSKEDLGTLSRISQERNSDRGTVLLELMKKHVGNEGIKSISFKEKFVIFATTEQAANIMETLPVKYAVAPEDLLGALIREAAGG